MLSKIPLFPLGLVLLPGMQLPLHIFEERYKLMISECLADERPFGLVFFDGESIHTIGCAARVTDVIKRYDDGRMDIVTRGERRFVVEDFIEEKAYMEGNALFFDDQDAPPEHETADSRQTGLRLLRELIDAGFLDESLDRFETMGAKDLSFAIAAQEGFTPAERQRFLEMTSVRLRLEKSVQALGQMLQRLKLNQEIQRIIGGNGRPSQTLFRQLYGAEKE